MLITLAELFSAYKFPPPYLAKHAPRIVITSTLKMFVYYHISSTYTHRFKLNLKPVMDKHLLIRVGFSCEYIFALISHAEERCNAVK
jgi:hypothetical protein